MHAVEIADRHHRAGKGTRVDAGCPAARNMKSSSRLKRLIHGRQDISGSVFKAFPVISSSMSFTRGNG
jgi:hypothetical protein